MIDNRYGGWQPSTDTALGSRSECLILRSTGGDPFVHTRLNEPFAAPIKVLVEARTKLGGSCRIFWAEGGDEFREQWSVPWSVPS